MNNGIDFSNIITVYHDGKNISFANKYKQSIPIKLRSNLEKRNLGNLWRPCRQKLLTGISYDDYEPVF